MVKVIVVDDHPIFRLGLAASLAEMEHVELVGEAATAGEVLDLVERTSPDLVLLDLHLPDKSGLEVNRSLAANYPNVKVVVLTMSEDHHATVAAVRDGARGYIVKRRRPDSHRTRHRLGDGRRRRPRPRRRAGHGRARPAPRRDRVIAIPTIEPPRGRHLGADRPRP
jgi:DNA-binding NarL/FixJ family response regulator